MMLDRIAYLLTNSFGLMEADPAIESAKKILDYLSRHSPVTFKGRDVLRHTYFKKMDEVMPGLKILTERGYIREAGSVRSSAGRPEAMTYEVNPKYLKSTDKTDKSQYSGGFVNIVSENVGV